MSLGNKINLLRSRKNLIAYFLSMGLIGTTLLCLMSYISWTKNLELISHFRMQYLVISFLLLILLSLTRKKYLIITGLFCFTIILAEIIPWYIPQALAEIESTAKIRIILSNVNVKNVNYSSAISLAREENPDMAVFIEVNNAWVERLNSLKRDFSLFCKGREFIVT